MGKKNLALFLFLLTVLILLSPKLGQSINLCRWQGYANKSGTLVSTTDFISIYNGTKTYNATIFSSGMYTADVQAESTDAHITFKICGVYVAQGGQAWSCPASDYNTLNLSITLLANGASCSYSCACSGGYCCSGASQYISGNGTGTCQASACSAPSGEAAPPSGTAGTAGGAVTVVEEGESKTFAIIPASGTGSFNVTKSEDLKIMEINITVVTQVNSVKITIKEGSLPSGAPLPVAANVGLIYKYLEITKGNITDANISVVKIKFKVAKSWLNSNNISSNSIALQRYSAGTWSKLTTAKVGEDSKYYYYVTETNLLSVFAITGEKVVAIVECPYECCVGEAEYVDKVCSSGYECDAHTCKAIPACPTCPSPSAWSECVDGERARTSYRCSSETNYQCKSYTETEDCPPVAVEIPYMAILAATATIIIVVVVVIVWRKRKKEAVPIIKV